MYPKLFLVVFWIFNSVEAKKFTVEQITDAGKGCPILGTPAIDRDGLHVTLNKSDITNNGNGILNDKFRMRVGYAEVLETFIYKGCWNQGKTTYSFLLNTNDLGRCSSLCNSSVIGMMGKNCYCNISLKEVTNNCGECYKECECDRPKDASCGYIPSTIVVYTKSEDQGHKVDGKEDERKRCLTVNIKTEKYSWRTCSELERCYCQSVKEITTKTTKIEYKLIHDLIDWSHCAQRCLDDLHYPVGYIDFEKILIKSGVFWTGIIRTQVIRNLSKDINEKSPGYQQGFITYEASNGRFELEFESNTEITYELCAADELHQDTNTTTVASESFPNGIRTREEHKTPITTTSTSTGSVRATASTDVTERSRKPEGNKAIVMTTAEKGQKFEIKHILTDCHLGSPTIDSGGTNVDLDINDILNNDAINDDFHMWIGYEEVFKSFVYKGCKDPVEKDHQFMLVGRDLGRCYSMCKFSNQAVQYIGMEGKSCYCIQSVKETDFGKCGEYLKCENPGGVSCGGHKTQVAVYRPLDGKEKVFCKNYESTSKLCLAAKTKPQKSATSCVWKRCNNNSVVKYICQTDHSSDSESDDNDSHETEYKLFPANKMMSHTWQTLVDECFEKKYDLSDNNTTFPHKIPDQRQSNDGSDKKDENIRLHWTGQIRGYIIIHAPNPSTHDKKRRGYIVYNNEQFELKFGDYPDGKIKHALCLHKPDHHSHDSDREKDDNNSHVLVYIIIAILIVVIVALVVILVMVYRKRICSKSKPKPKTVSNNSYGLSDGIITATSTPLVEDIDEEGEYHTIRPVTEYVSINETALDKSEERMHDNLSNKPNLPRRAYDKVQLDNDVYNKLDEKAAIKTGTETYNTFSEFIARASGVTKETDTYEMLDKTFSSQPDTYNTLSEVNSSNIRSPYSNNEHIADHIGEYYILEEQSKTEKVHTRAEMNAPKKGKNNIPETQVHARTDDTSEEIPGEYFILEKQPDTEKISSVNHESVFKTSARLLVKPIMSNEQNEETVTNPGEYFILEKPPTAANKHSDNLKNAPKSNDNIILETPNETCLDSGHSTETANYAGEYYILEKQTVDQGMENNKRNDYPEF